MKQILEAQQIIGHAIQSSETQLSRNMAHRGQILFCIGKCKRIEWEQGKQPKKYLNPQNVFEF